MSKEVSARFWSKVNKAAPNGCWEWFGAKTPGGYGTFWTGSEKIQAHRWAWQEANGPIPKGLLGCHKCDNPPCVNPEHIFIGTHKDNHDDAKKKGRWIQEVYRKKGEASKRARTHCLRGHPLFGENLIITNDRGRRCRQCLLAGQRRYDQKRYARGMRRKNAKSS